MVKTACHRITGAQRTVYGMVSQTALAIFVLSIRGTGLDPLEKLRDSSIYRFRMRNRSHVIKVLELDEVDSRQCVHQEAGDSMGRLRRALANHVQHRYIE